MEIVEVEPGVYSVIIDGMQMELRVALNGASAIVSTQGRSTTVDIADPREWAGASNGKQSSGKAKIASPMPGKVVRLLCALGDAVAAGQAVAVVEAMKMQNELKTPIAGTVKKVLAAPGDTVLASQVLVEVDADAR